MVVYNLHTDHVLAFLGHPMWPIDIVAGHNGLTEKDGAIFASCDSSKTSQEHRELFKFPNNLIHMFFSIFKILKHKIQYSQNRIT